MNAGTGVAEAQLLRVQTGPAQAAEPALAAAFKVLSDARRFQIILALMHAELCVCEVIDQLGMSQTLASHHLGVLRRAGLVRSRRDAQWVYYSVDPGWLHSVARAFRSVFDPAHLAPEALYGASSACAGVDRDPGAAPCCARHEHHSRPSQTRGTGA